MTLGRLVGIGAAGAASLLLFPGAVLGHELTGAFVSPIPLPVNLAGAAAAVALSFAAVLLRDVVSFGPARPGMYAVPAWLRTGLRIAGLLAVAWVPAQAIIGGASEADVSGLFLWTYGWVGLALTSALVGPAWPWLDPFTALHDAGAVLLRRVGLRGWRPAPYPASRGRWPAVAGFAAIVWLELVVTGGGGGRALVAGFSAYAAVTLLGMAHYGRDAWRANGEVFSVWFGLLGRIAPFALAGPPEAGLVRRRPFGAGLLEPGWSAADVALAAIAVISVLYDGLSQTQLWFDLAGLPGLAGATIALAASFATAIALALGAVRLVGSRPLTAATGRGAVGAGLVPIAAGYIAGHYLTALLVDGQRIVVAVSDPFQQAGTCSGQPSSNRSRLSSSPASCGPSSSGPWSAATCWGLSPATWRRWTAARRRGWRRSSCERFACASCPWPSSWWG